MTISLLFGAYGSALRFVAEDPNAPTVSNIFWAGSISGFINAFFSCPMELGNHHLMSNQYRR